VNEDGALFDSGFDGGGPFRDTPEAGGISLESALRDFGPAAIDDLIPRVRVLAARLDAAHASGVIHGALHPSKVIVRNDATSIIAGSSSVLPYAAPELKDNGVPTAKSDQYALAAIVYEWLFGRPIDHPATRPVDVRTMPGVDRAALSKAFTRALAPKPGDRFASCTAFCDALAGSVVPELPLLALDVEPSDVDPVLTESAPDIDDISTSLDSERDTAFLAEDRQPDFDAIDQVVPRQEAAVASWNPAAAPVTPSRDAQRFSGMALILAAIVGSIFGFAAGYMARPRALQTGPPATIATVPGTEHDVATAPAANTPAAQASPPPKAPEAPKAPVSTGRLLVRSVPSGATVSVDGVEKGVTPLPLRDLELGTREVAIARRGYITANQKVSLTSARPSRTLDVRLTAAATPAASAAPGRTGATRPAVTTGSLSVESRPTGAAVTINGRPSGTTPLSINDLPPGEYRIMMTLPGFRNFATTVRVAAGERTRAAASLTAQEQE
jgi:hypothetical protein